MTEDFKIQENPPVYQTWLEYFKNHNHLTDREKNVFMDSIVLHNTPILFYSPMKDFCQCYKDLKSAAMIPVDDIKKMICSKCKKPIKDISK